MIRVVLDTNILISGFLYPGSAPSRIVNLAADGSIRNAVSSYIIAEFRRILMLKFKRSQPETDDLISIIVGFSDVIDTVLQPSTIELDENDIPILACAIAAQARFIVTGDKGILAAKRYRLTRFVTATDMLSIAASSRRKRQ